MSVASISTARPGHGGFKLSAKVNERIPLFIRQESFGGLGLKGWYEEDEDAQIVIVAFGHLFTEKERQHAREYLGKHHPTWLFALDRIATVGGTFGSLENINEAAATFAAEKADGII